MKLLKEAAGRLRFLAADEETALVAAAAEPYARSSSSGSTRAYGSSQGRSRSKRPTLIWCAASSPSGRPTRRTAGHAPSRSTAPSVPRWPRRSKRPQALTCSRAATERASVWCPEGIQGRLRARRPRRRLSAHAPAYLRLEARDGRCRHAHDHGSRRMAVAPDGRAIHASLAGAQGGRRRADRHGVRSFLRIPQRCSETGWRPRVMV